MARAVLKAVLTLCFSSVVLVACSESPDRPDRGHNDGAPRTTVAQSATSGGTAGYVERTVEGMVLRKDERVLAIEEAELQRGEEGRDEIVVKAKIRGQREDNRDCFLMEERAWLAVRRSFETGDLPERRIESLWADPLSAHEFSAGETYVEVFQENPNGEAPDPRRTPFFALCFKDADPDGNGTPPQWYDVAHVEGTPEPSS